jgi:cyclic pyranopterin phosphate synthase
MADKLTHLDESGQARMVDVGAKPETDRVAVARSAVELRPETLDLIESGGAPKGDVLAAARLAGIMAAKRTADLIPLCHTLPLTRVEVELRPGREGDRAWIEVLATAATHARTGVEMEALVAAAIAALTIYDMCKAVDRAMVVGETYLLEKRGGQSGLFRHPRHGGHAPVL